MENHDSRLAHSHGAPVGERASFLGRLVGAGSGLIVAPRSHATDTREALLLPAGRRGRREAAAMAPVTFVTQALHGRSAGSAAATSGRCYLRCPGAGRARRVTQRMACVTFVTLTPEGAIRKASAAVARGPGSTPRSLPPTPPPAAR